MLFVSLAQWCCLGKSYITLEGLSCTLVLVYGLACAHYLAQPLFLGPNLNVHILNYMELKIAATFIPQKPSIRQHCITICAIYSNFGSVQWLFLHQVPQSQHVKRCLPLANTSCPAATHTRSYKLKCGISNICRSLSMWSSTVNQNLACREIQVTSNFLAKNIFTVGVCLQTPSLKGLHTQSAIHYLTVWTCTHYQNPPQQEHYTVTVRMCFNIEPLTMPSIATSPISCQLK